MGLIRVLGEMRCQYEAMSDGISLQAMSCSEELQCCQSEIPELGLCERPGGGAPGPAHTNTLMSWHPECDALCVNRLLGFPQILCSKAENARLIVQIDNAKLAATSHDRRHESELALRQLVEADMCGTQKLLDDATLAKSDLEAQQESLKEEQLALKSNHEQEVKILRSQLGDKLRIELDTEPTVDLSRVLEEMRCQYETMVETNRQDVEQWFQAQSEGINLQAMSCSEELQCCQSEILELRCSVNALEVERQAQHTLKDCLQNSLCEAEARYGTELAQMQSLISNVEEQLSEIRADLERQNQEYQVLLDVKARLEDEINTYRKLLESEDCKLPCNPCSTPPSCVPAPAPAPCATRPSCAPRIACGPGSACGACPGSRF
ncbi:keratin, type I cuticular Ha8 [Otolemur garnettii]|uniref:keratin, type I cuticular Ha8 n=1 Tax=Otolemur garnettii TaxID=30611 RepID=UPI0006441296|nr:keratin, type I cuticular Ha8 [Otolemur garnettii]